MGKLLKILGVLAVLSISLALIACGSPSPSSTTQRFFNAIEKDDISRAGRYATTDLMAAVA